MKGGKRVLEEVCPYCGYPTLEEKRAFQEKELAVSTCLNPQCDFYNWELPKAWLDEDGNVDDELLQDSSEWARMQAETLKREFLSKQPVKITVTPTIHNVEEYLNSKSLAYSTRRSYFVIISRFLEWFNRKIRG